MKRRVFLGLPVILGILFYIWYIFHASDNVAYSDYIRLINSYLPDAAGCLSENPVYAFRTIRTIFAEGLKCSCSPDASPTGLRLLPYTQTETTNEACQAHSL